VSDVDKIHGDTLTATATPEVFAGRHIGPGDDDVATMLRAIGLNSLDELSETVVPGSIRWRESLNLPPAADEARTLAELRDFASRNESTVPMIGLGYHGTRTPGVILRNILENPAWYTAYTPYQPEISQGRLAALINFQTMIEDLTGLPISNASLLDEPTAAAEAMSLARRAGKIKTTRFLIDADTHPQTLAVLATRAHPQNIDLVTFDVADGLPEGEFFGLLLSYPGSSGAVRDLSSVVAAAQARGAIVAVAADLLALTLLRAPGEFGADVVVGSAQRFGVPLGFGGPHAGYMAVRAGLERSMPGRLVGVSVDASGRPAYRLALQTREQHIRREKATSNICTAQVLLAVMASAYAAYHGPDGLRRIASNTHRYAVAMAGALRAGGIGLEHAAFFDTIRANVPGRAADVVAAAAERNIDLWLVNVDTVAINTSETTSLANVQSVLAAFADVFPAVGEPDVTHLFAAEPDALPIGLLRSTEFLTHPVFNEYHSETGMLRYLRRLADLDIALDRAMIPLGSCTMKLNATTEMAAITWPEFADLHPFAPLARSVGFRDLIGQLETWLAEITGYDAVSVQPNAGSQGEFAGLLAIRGYHQSRGDAVRDVCLIPSSAHGTNAASAVMAGLRVVVVACDDEGNVDVADLERRIDEHRDRLAALMITYPSTHGVFETAVTRICSLVHDAGGQVYVDGANLNALVGLARPGKFGADVSHLNLHKTFCIPHGGGGPGVGPVGVRAHLAPFLPSHPLRPEAGPVGRGYTDGGQGPISGAPWGSAGILPIPWAYIRMMGADGLLKATQVAILAANYIANRLDPYFPVLYTGDSGRVAHECILDLRGITHDTGVTVDDVAKRLIDYGFHAPTMSFPVAGTFMVEPTESETLHEIDRFCDAMIAIRAEIDRVASGEWPAGDNPLVNAPHTAASVVDDWPHPYTRAEAVYPVDSLRHNKYWAPVRRIDGAFGDRNLICSCPPPEAFAD
jgi:glycine dehydrogenase